MLPSSSTNSTPTSATSNRSCAFTAQLSSQSDSKSKSGSSVEASPNQLRISGYGSSQALLDRRLGKTGFPLLHTTCWCHFLTSPPGLLKKSNGNISPQRRKCFSSFPCSPLRSDVRFPKKKTTKKICLVLWCIQGLTQKRTGLHSQFGFVFLTA